MDARVKIGGVFSDFFTPVGVIVSGSEKIGQHHASIFFWNENDSEYHFLELNWHFILHCGRPENLDGKKVAWIILHPALDDVQIVNFASFVRTRGPKIKEGKIPYGLGPYRNWFDNQGNIIIASDNVGLTCATFVLALFACQGIDIVSETNWESSDGDSEFNKFYIGELIKYGERHPGRCPKLDEHVTRLRENPTLVRIRPPQVGGSASAPAFPVSFENACSLSSELLDKMFP